MKRGGREGYRWNDIHIPSQRSRGIAGLGDPVEDEVYGLGFEVVGEHGWRDILEEARADA